MNKIVSFTPKNNGCYWYRNKTPFDALKRQGWDTHIQEQGEMVDPDTRLGQFSRGYNPGYEQFAFLVKSKGIKLWYECDDALDLVKPENPFSAPTKLYLGSYYFFLHESDFITTTNDMLAAHLRSLTNKPVHVFPNCINPKEWKKRKGEGDKLRIGFAGSASHVKDLNIVLPVIIELQKKYDFTFVIWGLDADCGDLEKYLLRQTYNCGGNLESLAYGRAVKEFYNNMKQIRHEWHDSCRWEMFTKKLAELDLDIGLCPLEDNDFNIMKSPIKFYEYATVGTVSLASNVLPFRKEECMAVSENDFQSWYDSIESLIIYTDLRESTLKAQQKYVEENRHIDTQIDKLETILTGYGYTK